MARADHQLRVNRARPTLATSAGGRLLRNKRRIARVKSASARAISSRRHAYLGGDSRAQVAAAGSRFEPLVAGGANQALPPTSQCKTRARIAARNSRVAMCALARSLPLAARKPPNWRACNYVGRKRRPATQLHLQHLPAGHLQACAIRATPSSVGRRKWRRLSRAKLDAAGGAAERQLAQSFTRFRRHTAGRTAGTRWPARN